MTGPLTEPGSEPNGSRRSYAEWAARVRVPGGFALTGVYLLWAQPEPRFLFAGAAVALVGLLLRAWSAGCLEKNQKLATGGPYAYARNPLYLGSAVAGVGFAIAGGRWWFFLLLALFLAAVYWPVILREQAHLEKLFPAEFPAYARSVPVIWPRFTSWQGSAAGSFRWRQYWRNREYEAFFAYLLIVLLLWGKMFWM